MSQRRLEILQQAASLDPRSFAGNRLVGERNFEEACKSDWNPWDGTDGIEIDDNETEIPVLDAITRTPLAKDDVVVLSDGKCYSKESMRSLLAQGVVGLFTGRANLPLSGQPMTDLDYALLDQDPPTLESSADARARTSQVGMDALATQTTDAQRQYERMRRQGMTPAQIAARIAREQTGSSTIRRPIDGSVRDYQDDFVWPEKYRQLADVVAGRDTTTTIEDVLNRDTTGELFNDSIAANDAILVRLSKLPNANAEKIMRIVRPYGMGLTLFNISVLTKLFYDDDNVNIESIMRQVWPFNLFQLDSELPPLKLYAEQLGRLPQPNLSERLPDPIKFLIRKIYLKGTNEQIRFVPQLIDAYTQPVRVMGRDMEALRIGRILDQTVLDASNEALSRFHSGKLVLPVANNDLDAIEQIATSDRVFNGTIDQNNRHLIILSLLPNVDFESIARLLETLPVGESRFSLSTLADLFPKRIDLEVGDDAAEFLTRRWLLLRPDLFQIDSDLSALKKYVAALAKAEMLSYNICEIRPDRLIDLIQTAYQRDRLFSPDERAAIIDAYLQPIQRRSAQCDFDLPALLRRDIDFEWDAAARAAYERQRGGAPSLRSQSRQERRDRSTRYNPI